MAVFRNVSDRSIEVRFHGAIVTPPLVEPGATFEIADEWAYAPKLVGLPVERVELQADAAPPAPTEVEAVKFDDVADAPKRRRNRAQKVQPDTNEATAPTSDDARTDE